ncbi:DNA polymerase III subunit chi [Thalassotalea sp. ND16A]|uniref:DNA polymerase III subunit chi n=1 Tax=Thalassotalea sp. ND16A TaxID=1535422 RepID=UPI00051D2440|nr:DNA polymerase III subunit chi [Thalassotalea sp. ND16A]KGJ89339.1 DNA-directed DNA polymerase [Thalassotalea sp. ND16A]
MQVFFNLVTDASTDGANDADDASDAKNTNAVTHTQSSVSEQQLQSNYLYWACVKAAICYRQNQRVFMFCDDQQMAHQLDELLWSFESDSFVPHNLSGEGLASGSPVEISWQAPTNNRNVLINLSGEVPSFASQFSQIIDFVPVDDELKKLARLRYRSYQQLGFTVNTAPANKAA